MIPSRVVPASDVTHPLDALFNPARVALVGASDRPGRMGTLFMRNLSEFAGEVIPVTTSQQTIEGRKTYPSLRDVPGQVDLAIVVVAASSVPAVIGDAAAAGVRAAIIVSGGFAETGREGASLQAAAVDAARAGAVRLLGPNCFGIQNCKTGLNASMAVGTAAAAGNIALVTQSGAYGMATYTLALEDDLGFSKTCATGNQADIGEAEVLGYLGDDPESFVLCFFVEWFKDARSFCAEARRISPHKPILLAKTGRTDAGARAAVSHTAALADPSKIWEAVLQQSGAIVARSGLEMLDAAKALDWQPVPRGPRVGIVTNSGGIGVELTDLLSEEGLAVPELSTDLQARLSEALPRLGSSRNPVDVTPAWAQFAELYPRCIRELARSGEVDIVVPVLVERSALDPEVAEAVTDAIDELTREGTAVPVYACWMAPRKARPNMEALQSSRVPCFEWPLRTARAAAHAWRYGRARRAVRPVPEVPVRPTTLPQVAPGALGPEDATALVAAFGIKTPRQAVCPDEDGAASAAEELGYPVVAKLVSKRFTHKSDVGGVRSGLMDEDAVRRSVRQLLDVDPDASILVQEQALGVEVIVGGYRDSQFGPVAMVGLGGILVELFDDVSFRLAPIDEQEAMDALRALRGYSILEGARGMGRADVDSVAETMVAVSRLMAAVPEVTEIDLNPVLASEHGALAVDVRAVVAGTL
jgi:acyl-CoA synthetase (NDP forming)